MPATTLLPLPMLPVNPITYLAAMPFLSRHFSARKPKEMTTAWYSCAAQGARLKHGSIQTVKRQRYFDQIRARARCNARGRSPTEALDQRHHRLHKARRDG